MSAAVFSGPRTDTSRRRQPRTTPAPRPEPKFDHWSVARNDDGTRIYHVRLPQLRTEVSRQLGSRCAEAAWRGIWDLLRDRERTGRTEAARERAARLCILDDVGVSGLARHTGKCRNTIRRQLAILEDMGLIRIVRPPVRMARGDDGRLKAKSGGQEPAVRIIVTYDPDVHGKPRRKAPSYGQSLPIEVGPEGGVYGQSLSTFQTSLQTELPPVADTDGIGAALADGPAPGLPAGASDPGPEPVPLIDVMAVATDEILAGRKGLPSPADPPHVSKPEPSRRPARPHGDGQPEKSFKERADEWNRRDPETERMVADYQRSRAQRKARAAAGTPAGPTASPTPDRPSGATAGAVPAIQPDAEFDAAAQALDELIRGMRQSAANDEKAGHRDEWRASRVGAA